MRAFFLTCLLVVAASASLLGEQGLKFQAFKQAHSKTYKNQVEEATRFTIFKDNLISIEEHNALFEQGLVSYKKGINQFTDMTKEEFRAYLGTHPKPSFNATLYEKTGVAVPASVDWRTEGYVTPVKNQGQCGSCWSFSVTGTTEGAYFRKYGKLVSLSEQQLVDCATQVNYGCDGGYMAETMPYVRQYGLQTEESYPYTARDGRCQYDQSKVVTKVTDFTATYQDEAALLEAVATIGPVSVAMDASYLSEYNSGIYQERYCSPRELNHGVLVVGYGSQNGKDYWIVKNSWGTSWGENGYFRIVRGTNECGISEEEVWPVVA